MTGRVDVLAIGAHPDDAELGCGGTLLLAAGSGLRTGVVDLTAGEMATRGSPERRARERDEASALLGLSVRCSADLPDTAVGTDPGHRLVVAEILRSLRPAIVLAPWCDDAHPDHAAAGRLAREACFLAGLGRLPDGPPHRPRYLLHYMLHTPFDPSLVVDVTSTWTRRMQAVRAYRSQFDATLPGEPPTRLSAPDFLERIEARAVFYGGMIDARHGEPYRGPGPLGLRTLVPLVEGPPRGGQSADA